MEDQISIEHITLESIFNDLPIGMLVLNEKGLVLAHNTSFRSIVLGKERNIIGEAIWPLITEDSIGKENKSICHAQDYIIRTYKQQLLTLKINSYQTTSTAKPSIIGILSGENKLSKLEAELERKTSRIDDMEDELEQENELSEMKSRFLSIASHEFRTPLAGILSSLNLINRYRKAEQPLWSQLSNHRKIENHLDKIHESVKNLTTIINRFLALGNISKGEIPVKYTQFDLQKALLHQKNQIEEIGKPGQKIRYKHIGIPSLVNLDQYILKNIMNNILSNAMKFSHEGSEILMNSEINQSRVLISIQDHGIGIPQKEQAKVFRRFYRANNALTFEEGTGLGLNIVKKYVALMDGQITFESEENRGTTFYITFPKKQKP